MESENKPIVQTDTQSSEHMVIDETQADQDVAIETPHVDTEPEDKQGDAQESMMIDELPTNGVEHKGHEEMAIEEAGEVIEKPHVDTEPEDKQGEANESMMMGELPTTGFEHKGHEEVAIEEAVSEETNITEDGTTATVEEKISEAVKENTREMVEDTGETAEESTSEVVEGIGETIDENIGETFDEDTSETSEESTSEMVEGIGETVEEDTGKTPNNAEETKAQYEQLPVSVQEPMLIDESQSGAEKPSAQEISTEKARPMGDYVNKKLEGSLVVQNVTATAADAQPKTDYKAMSVRAYLEAAVVPVLLQGLSEVSKERPENPLEFLGHYLLARSKNNSNV